MKSIWPLGDKDLRLGILGMTEGNGHPYSWSAMYNGYDRKYMDKCPFAAIPTYLNNLVFLALTSRISIATTEQMQKMQHVVP